MNFNKPPIFIENQLQLLEERGLSCPDRDKTISYLTNLGYYRLSGYSYPFRTTPDRTNYKESTTIDQVVRIYDFDRKLRLLVSDAMERIEIGLRSRIVSECCMKYQSAHWFTDSSNFHPQFNHGLFLKKIEQTLGIKYDQTTDQRLLPEKHQETFIQHYYDTYSGPYLPPFWMVAEIVTLGNLSNLFKGIKDPKLKADIAKPFGVPAKILGSWLHSTSHLRNICAHHGRLWNRVFSIKPRVANKHTGQIHSDKKFERQAATLLLLLDVCAPNHSWRTRFYELTNEYPEIDVAAMGFNPDWAESTIWKI